jgi:hypothetical protein
MWHMVQVGSKEKKSLIVDGVFEVRQNSEIKLVRQRNCRSSMKFGKSTTQIALELAINGRDSSAKFGEV